MTYRKYFLGLAVSQAQARRFVRTCLRTAYNPEDPIPKTIQVQLALFDWLTHIGMEDTASWEILRVIEPAIEQKGSKFLHLVLADLRWVGCTGREDWYDLRSSQNIPELPREAVTQIHCNVRALKAWICERIRRLPDAGKPNSQNVHPPKHEHQ